MVVNKKSSNNRPSVTTHTNLQILTSLHEAMKAIREARRAQEGGDVPLWRIYREAVEQYVSARPQQKLLEEFSESGKTNSAGARGAARM